MKFPHFSAFLSLALAGTGFSTTLVGSYTTDFPISTYNTMGMEVAGVDNWVITDPGLQGSHGVNQTLSFVTTSIDGSPCAAIGGWNDIPSELPPTTVYLAHPALVDLRSSSFSTDFAIAKSNAFYPGRDGFGFSFRDEDMANLFTISFVPFANATNDAYQVYFSVGNGAKVAATDFRGDPLYIFHNGLYSLDFDFTPNGANPNFTATIQGSSSMSFSGTAAGLGTAQIAFLGAEYNALPGQLGNNFMAFDNINLVPEPSSILLLSLGGLSWAARRRRA